MSLLIQKEGILTTLQGRGDFGMQRYGINPRGPMDATAARLVNLVLENDENESVIEMHFPAAQIVFEKACVFAIGGADFRASLNGNNFDNWCCVHAKATSILKFDERLKGNRCYLAVRGGIALLQVTNVSIKTPSSRTNQLRKGDRLVIKDESADSASVLNRRISRTMLSAYSRFPTVRIVAGAEYDLLPDEHRRAFVREIFTITGNSNRMGFWLKGPNLELIGGKEMVSAAVTFGTIQLLPDGQMIILMADHQTSGGYPRIANVISVDLPLIAQLGENDKVTFQLIDIDEAESLTIQFERDIQRLRIGCRFGRYW